MTSFVLDAFLETAAVDAAELDEASDVLSLLPRSAGSTPPRIYDGVLREVEHLERVADGTVQVSASLVAFTIEFPIDYCRSTDPLLQFRVARVHTPILHPNCQGGILCLGSDFRPGTRLRGVVHEVYAIVCGRNFAAQSALDPWAAEYYLAHLDQVRALRSRPLLRRQIGKRRSSDRDASIVEEAQ
jgi:hypothetical protein